MYDKINGIYPLLPLIRRTKESLSSALCSGGAALGNYLISHWNPLNLARVLSENNVRAAGGSPLLSGLRAGWHLEPEPDTNQNEYFNFACLLRLPQSTLTPAQSWQYSTFPSPQYQILTSKLRILTSSFRSISGESVTVKALEWGRVIRKMKLIF